MSFRQWIWLLWLIHRYTSAKPARGLVWEQMSCQQSPNSFTAYFGVASLALYATTPNHVLGQWLGCPAPVLATLRSALSARVVKGELLWLCFRFIWLSTLVEKAKNRLSWCCESWSTTRWLIKIYRDSLRVTRRTFFQVIYVTHHIGIGIIRFMPLVVSHSSVLPLISKSHRFCPRHFCSSYAFALWLFDRQFINFITNSY